MIKEGLEIILAYKTIEKVSSSINIHIWHHFNELTSKIEQNGYYN